MKRFYKDIPVVFVDKDVNLKNINAEKFNIILSPSLYWTKIEEDLPVKRISQIKNLAPSLFDGMLPNGEFEYKISKLEENKYLLIAYDKKQLKLELEKLNIDLSKVESIYFAQNEFNNFSNAIEIDQEHSLVNLNSIVQKIPSKYLKGYKTELSTIMGSLNLSKEKISSYDLEDTIIDNKSFYILASILSFLAILNVVEYFQYKQEIGKVSIAKEKILDKYNLPQTTFELKSIKSKFNSIQKRQIKLREKISYLDKIKLQNGEYIENLSLSNRKISLNIKLNEPKRAEDIKKYLKKEFKIEKMRVKNKILYTKISI